jgi:hypothetical protein
MADDDGNTCSARLQVGLDDGRTLQEETEATATSDEEVPPFNEEQIALLDEKIDAKVTFSANTHILLPEDTFSFFAFVDVFSLSFLVASLRSVDLYTL